jgi:succinate dehydrogenase/fumarate reductase cytochrome b subunit
VHRASSLDVSGAVTRRRARASWRKGNSHGNNFGNKLAEAMMAATMTTNPVRAMGLRVRLQAASGVLVAVFVGVHLLNTFLLALSFAAYDGVQAALRIVYQQPVIEAVLVLAIVVHMGCGIGGMLARRRDRASGVLSGSGPALRPPARLRWQRRAGWVLLAFVGGHVLATRGVSLWFDVAPGAQGLGFTMAFMPAYFYPYYFLLGLAGLYHGVTGIDAVLARARAGIRVTRLVRPITLVGAFALVAALLGAGGVLYPTPDPWANDYAAVMLRLMGAAP